MSTDPYTKTRIILMNGTEFEANWFSHQFSRHCTDMDLRREIAVTRRVEKQQQMTISCLKPIDESPLETTIAYEQLAVDLTAILAKREPDAHVKMALDFALLEDFDHLYRYADLLEMDKGIRAEELVGRYTEIMPGRPTIAEHRYPYDNVKPMTNFKSASPITKLNVSIIDATVAQYGDYIVQSDVLELTSIDNTIVEATQLLGNQAGLTIDTIHRNILNSGSNVTYAPSIGADGTKTAIDSRANVDASCKMTAELVKRIVTKLKGKNAPKIDGYYVAIIHPHVAFDLMCDEQWIDVQKYATPENMLKGELGKLGGCRFVESTEAQIWKAGKGNCAVYSTLFLGANAYGITEITGGGLQTIIKQKGSAGTGDPLDQRSSIGWKTMTTAEILVNEYMVRCESGSSFSDTATAN
jgi:N4-gp56 family major capsid protein